MSNKYPVLRLRGYDEVWNDGHFDYVLRKEYRDIPMKIENGRPKLYNGKPRYSMDGNHDFCYIESKGDKGVWVVANLSDPNSVAGVCNCGPDDTNQNLHGDFPPQGRWSQYNHMRDARWHVEKIPAGYTG